MYKYTYEDEWKLQLWCYFKMPPHPQKTRKKGEAELWMGCFWSIQTSAHMFRANVQYSVDFAHWRHQLAVKAGLGCTADYHWHSSVDAVGFEVVSRALSWGWSTGVIFGGDGSIWRNGSFLLTMLSNLLEFTRPDFFLFNRLILRSRVLFLDFE